MLQAVLISRYGRELFRLAIPLNSPPPHTLEDYEWINTSAYGVAQSMSYCISCRPMKNFILLRIDYQNRLAYYKNCEPLPDTSEEGQDAVRLQEASPASCPSL